MDFDLLKSSRLNPADLQATPDCLSDTDIALLATDGAMPNAETQLDHLATCDWCSMRMNLVQKGMRQRAWFPYAALAAAAAVILSVGAGLYWYTNTAGRAERLLAKAYTQARSTEWRLPDSGWSAPTVARGAEAPRPAPLLEALSLLGSSSSNDTAIQALRGRADILEYRADSAIRTLEALRAAGPPTPDLLCDLAVAYAVAADLRGQDGHYERTVEFALQARRLDPNHRRAQFNLALAYERLHMLDKAAAEWESYIAGETDARWLAEARDRLAKLNQRRATRAGMLPNATTLIPEFTLEEMAVVWLVDDRRRASTTGEQLIQRHNDHWLADAAREPFNSKPLLETTQANRRGDPDAALQLSTKHASRYPPGSAHAARLGFERIYALSRRLDAAACVAQSLPLLATSRQRRYAWITVQGLSVAAICRQMAGEPGAGRQLHAQAISVAAEHHLDAIALRLKGVLHNAQILDGDPYTAWRENWQNLAVIANGPYPAVRMHQCLMNYSQSAEQLGWKAAAWAFGTAAADVIAPTPHRLTEAANRSRAASMAAMAGMPIEAAQELDHSRTLFEQATSGVTRQRYKDSVRLIEGEAQWHAGRFREALDILEPLAAKTIPDRERWHVARVIGLSRRGLGLVPQAVEALRQSVQQVESAASGLPTRAEANRLRRNALDAYRALAEALVDQGETREALEVWLRAHGSSKAPDLVFLARDNGYAAWTGGGLNFQTIAASRQQVRTDATALLAVLRDPRRPAEHARLVARRLFDQVLAPLPRTVTAQPAITVLPDAELAALPFHALVDASGHWLSESAMVTISASAQPPAAPSLQGNALVVHSPAVPSLLPALPQARAEAAAVSSRFPNATLLEGSNATSDALRTALPRAGLFHFSGHGYLAESLGGLWLSDGPAGAALLRALPIPSCKLAVLSACLTAEGASAGLANPEALVRSFLDAGAATVLASRWMIDSEATTLLMETFYDRLARSAAPEQALGAAMAAVRANPRYSHPYYWAAFHFYT